VNSSSANSYQVVVVDDDIQGLLLLIDWNVGM